MKWILAFSALGLLACSSEPTVQEPAWTKQPTRVVDNGYIVYVGAVEDISSERAQFKAEGMALEDLANECSFIPKGTRIEDRFVEPGQNKHLSKAFVKVALEFTECDEARKTQDPSRIKELGNVAFTEQLKKYQDLTETGEMSKEYAQVQPNLDGAPPPDRGTMSDSTHFYVVRQYAAYQNEVVILSPPTAYAPNSPETQHYTAVMRPAVAQIDTYQAANPQLAKSPQPWSQVPNKPPIARPANLMQRSSATPNRGFSQPRDMNGRAMSSRGSHPPSGQPAPPRRKRKPRGER